MKITAPAILALLLLTGNVARADAVADASQCDLFAASPADHQRPQGIAGVADADMDKSKAVSLCMAALNTNPGNPRIMFEAARALQLSGNAAAMQISLLEGAANKNYTAAMKSLARLYTSADSKAANRDKAFVWYEKLANAGDAEAMFDMAALFNAGDGAARDQAAAITWYARAYFAGNKNALAPLQALYHKENIVPPEPSLAAKFYQILAATGDSRAMNDLAVALESGHGVIQDKAQAFILYQKSARAGDSTAMKNLAVHYAQGLTVKNDIKKALFWFNKAVAAGNTDGMIELGYLYYIGKVLRKDHQKATALFKQAAEGGNIVGMNNYGFNLVTGDGVEKNVIEGINWLQKGVLSGSGLAATSMAEVFEAGKDLPYDGTRAAQFYLLGLKRSDATAFRVLVENKGNALKPTTQNAVQAQLASEGLLASVDEGPLSSIAIDVLKTYPENPVFQ